GFSNLPGLRRDTPGRDFERRPDGCAGLRRIPPPGVRRSRLSRPTYRFPTTRGGDGMSSLATMQRGRTRRPPRLLVYGTPGIGKSTFGSQAPNPIFLPTEDGLDEIDCA